MLLTRMAKPDSTPPPPAPPPLFAAALDTLRDRHAAAARDRLYGRLTLELIYVDGVLQYFDEDRRQRHKLTRGT